MPRRRHPHSGAALRQPAHFRDQWLRYTGLSVDSDAFTPWLVSLAQWGEAHTQPQLLGTRLLDAHSLKPLRKVEIVSEDGRVLGVDDVVTQAPAP